MLAALTKELPGRVWEGKESLLPAVADVVEKCPAAALTFGGGEVVAALVAEAREEKSSYREAALRALGQVARRARAPDGSGGTGRETGWIRGGRGIESLRRLFPGGFPLTPRRARSDFGLRRCVD